MTVSHMHCTLSAGWCLFIVLPRVFCCVLRVTRRKRILELGKMTFTMAVLACVLLIQTGLVGGDPLKQFFSDVLVKVGQQVVLPCHSTTKESITDLNFFWYRKFPGEALRFLLQAHETAKNDKYFKDRFSMRVYKNKTAPLEIAEVSLQDTAIYYCVLKHALDGTGTTLTVIPKVTVEKSTKADVATTAKTTPLPTTFLTTNISLEITTKEQNTSALTAQLICTDRFDSSMVTILPDPEEQRVNMLSMAVLGLRVLLAKIVAFNTLMSIKLFLF